MNLVAIVGRLTYDPELRKTEGGKSVTNITIAVDRPFKTADGFQKTDFISVIAWVGLAENVVNHCKKGSLVSVRGRLQMSSYEKDGEKKNVSEVVAEKVNFLN